MNRRLAMAGAAMALSFAASTAGASTFTFVGSWLVADGPLWSSGGVQSLSGLEVAALLFGGSASDYAISTIDMDPDHINHSAFLDGYGDTTYLTTPASEGFVGVFGSSYDQGYGNYSAYVFDHACGIYYCDGGGGDLARNYAFRADGGVPEPATWGLMLMGFGGLGAALRANRRRTALATA